MNTKTYYIYDANGNFITPYTAQEITDNIGIFAAPENSTDIAPDFIEGTFPVFINGVWNNIADNRGQVWDKLTGVNSYFDTFPGSLPDNFTKIRKPEVGDYVWDTDHWRLIPPPDIDGFVNALVVGVNDPLLLNAIAGFYPALLPAISFKHWNIVQALFIDAVTKHRITVEQYHDVQEQLVTFNIPFILPDQPTP